MRAASNSIVNDIMSRLLLLITLFSIVWVGCTSERFANIERGSDVSFRQGYPEVRMMAVGLFDQDDMPGVSLHVDVVKGSLIYKSTDDVFTATFDLQVQVIQNLDNDEVLLQNRVATIEVTDRDPLVVDSSELATYTERINLLPGSYEVVIAVTDKASSRRTVRRSTVDIPDPEGAYTGITSVMLLGKSNEDTLGYQPVTTYFVPAMYDSLKFQFQVTRPATDVESSVNMQLERFTADSTFAREVAGIQHSPGSVAYRGIDYARPEIIESTQRTLVSETGNILIDYVTPVLPSANYRFAVTITETRDEEQPTEIFKAREFFISESPNFPNIQGVREFAEPLIYLMDRRQYARLMQIEDADSLKQTIDRFWLSNIPNVNKARQVIELYYTRVEQANKQFSNFKEGWKTDMGMVFILFGPPLQVENTLDLSIWFYSYNRNDPRTIFQFRRPRVSDRFFPFNHYIVERDRFYHNVEYEQRREWLTGTILNQN
ncbi:MAG: hypothetical protein HLUCCA01_02040 [Bacteroidetes bacterium HLUCCA01]|nr:MAG: hypothetical protein HLUCCA01_02040 [Bacteroidetes bacterium HLUCCA01]